MTPRLFNFFHSSALRKKINELSRQHALNSPRRRLRLQFLPKGRAADSLQAATQMSNPQSKIHITQIRTSALVDTACFCAIFDEGSFMTYGNFVTFVSQFIWFWLLVPVTSTVTLKENVQLSVPSFSTYPSLPRTAYRSESVV